MLGTLLNSGNPSSLVAACGRVFWNPHLLFKLFFKKFIFVYLVLVVLGLHCCVWVFSSWGEWRLLFLAVHVLVIEVASLAAERGLEGFSSCSCWPQWFWCIALVAPWHVVGSSRTWNQICVPCTGRQISIHCTTREVPHLLLFTTYIISYSFMWVGASGFLLIPRIVKRDGMSLWG